MNISEMQEQVFPGCELEEWKRTAEESLKGKPLDSLQQATYENIVLKPLYTRKDILAVSQYPGGEDLRRGITPLGYVTDAWKIAQQLSYTELAELKEKLKTALKSGQTALSFDISEEMIKTKGFLKQLIGEYYRQFPLALDAGKYYKQVLSALGDLPQTQEDSANIRGYAAADLLADISVSGTIPDHFSALLEEFSKTIQNANEKLPNVRTVLVNTAVYHNGGANAVQELGIAAAAGAFYMNVLSDLGADHAINKLIFKFSIGSNFFMEIAKLRAARIIWNKIAEAYGVKENLRGMQITAETSEFTKTVYDPYVNLLRGGNEAFAAVTGGVQYLHVIPHDQLTGSSAFSERIARNTQLILQEEAHLKKVIDPAGGSWYIEQLTNDLALKAWSFFQEIEANGGILEALKANWIQTKIADVYEKRKFDIFTRKQSIIGTNVYANVADMIPENNTQKAGTDSTQAEKFTISIMPVPQLRLSQPYEELRKRAGKLKQKTGLAPSIGLICLGSLKAHKSRLDFVRGFLSAGGINVHVSEPIHSVEEAIEFVKKSDTKHFCICGSNDIYQTLGIDILQSIKTALADRAVYLAGLPEPEQQTKWIENGLNQFIHIKSNCFETLSAILSEMEAFVNEQIQA
jgi:methylmalonyl-CoA mutase